MNEGAAIVERLQPIRLPAEFTTFAAQDFLTLFGVGLLLGISLMLLARLMIARQPAPIELARRAIEAVRRHTADIRLLELARLRATFLPEAAAPEWHDALYKPGAAVDFDRIETEILEAVRRRVD